MQIFNIITNIFTIISAIVGCFMFYFTFKNHKWLVEDRERQNKIERNNKLHKIFIDVYKIIKYLREDTTWIKYNYEIFKDQEEYENKLFEELCKHKKVPKDFFLFVFNKTPYCKYTENYFASRVLGRQSKDLGDMCICRPEIIDGIKNKTTMEIETISFDERIYDQMSTFFQDNNEIDIIYNEISKLK